MEVRFDLTNTDRKALVKAVSNTLGIEAKYLKMPTCAYEIGEFAITKEGTLVYDDCTVNEKVVLLMASLEEQGFKLETEEQADTLVVEIPKQGLTDLALDNLSKLIESKGWLIKKALGTNDLPIEETETTLRFPWFKITGTEGEGLAYAQLVVALVDMARNSKRITAKERTVPNEKYAFRCFLLRLGFIGEDFKVARKLFMQNLAGNTAWKDGAKHNDEVPEA